MQTSTLIYDIVGRGRGEGRDDRERVRKVKKRGRKRERESAQDRLRPTVHESMSFIHKSIVLRLTISFGVVCFPHIKPHPILFCVLE